MIEQIFLSVAVFSGLVLMLVLILNFAESKLLPQGDVTIEINGDSEKNINTRPGSTLLSVLAGQSVFLPSACGGGGTCVQCKCIVNECGGEILQTEKPHFSRKEISDGWRLGCQVKVKEDMIIQVPEEVFGIKKWEATVVSNWNVASFTVSYTHLTLPTIYSV